MSSCWVSVVLKLKSLLWLGFSDDLITHDLTTLVSVMPPVPIVSEDAQLFLVAAKEITIEAAVYQIC